MTMTMTNTAVEAEGTTSAAAPPEGSRLRRWLRRSDLGTLASELRGSPVRTIAIAIVFAASLGRMAGQFVRVRALDKLGVTLGFAPAPAPFQVRPEMLKREGFFEFTLGSGEVRTVPFDVGVRDRLGVPHHASMPVITAMFGAANFKKTFVRDTLRYAICNGAFLARASGVDDVRSFKWSYGEPDVEGGFFTIEVACK